MPIQPISPLSETYLRFIALLSPSPPRIIELDILPSSYPSTIHATSSSVALTKSLLASLFFAAHHVFFSYISSKKGGRGANQDLPGPAHSSYDNALQATMILLLWDPNHLTAANFRKRWLLFLRTPSNSNPSELQLQDSPFISALRAEVCFLSSLLTSPLTKATKSPTLWAQRLWLFTTFQAELLVFCSRYGLSFAKSNSNHDRKESTQEVPIEHTHPPHAPQPPQENLEGLFRSEMLIIMKAGERHPRNYYAWNYARQLFAQITTLTDRRQCNPPSDTPTASRIPSVSLDYQNAQERPTGPSLALSAVAVVHQWCLLHPRDISSWSFLIFLFENLLWFGGVNLEIKEAAPSAVNEEKERIKKLKVIKGVGGKTREFVRKYKWHGESLEWFLKAVEDLGDFADHDK